jgi:O-acetylhomoserine/O-acetylserine sulfhydrylase
MVDFP